jgi:hypothetical protein
VTEKKRPNRYRHGTVTELRLVIESLVWKYRRIRRKAAAANRELEDYKKGNKKTFRQQAEASEYAIRKAFEHFFQKHAVKVGMTSHGTTGAAIIDLVTYLTDRSNQLYANDSAVERKLNAEVKEAKLARHHAEQKAYELATKVRYYEQRYGVVTGADLSAVPSEPTDMSVLVKEADSFPWKRGNPGYLGDYSTIDLLHEVENRHVDLQIRVQNQRDSILQYQRELAEKDDPRYWDNATP